MMTGKNREQFEKWYLEFVLKGQGLTDTVMTDDWIKLTIRNICKAFEVLQFEMQIGMYLAYYDSLDLDCEVYVSYSNRKTKWTYDLNNEGIFDSGIQVDTRPEAYKEAFKKADKLVNEQLNKKG